MIESGKIYIDNSGKKLPAMNAGTVDGEFWCARLGDGRYYADDGTCLRLFGESNGGENLSPNDNFNISRQEGV